MFRMFDPFLWKKSTDAYFFIYSDVSIAPQGIRIRVGAEVFGKCLSEIPASGTGTKERLSR